MRSCARGGLANRDWTGRCHAIVDRGRVVGLWEFDVESQTIVWCSFGPKIKAMADAVKRAERFVAEELGDARTPSLDSPKSRMGRIVALRELG